MNKMIQKIIVLSAISCLLPLTASATEATEKTRSFGIGLDINNSTQEYVGNDDDYRGELFFEYRGEKFNMDNESASYRFFNRNNVQAEVLVKSVSRGHGFADSTTVAGMDEREVSLDLGLRAGYKTPFGLISIDATKDVGGKHKGAEADLRIGPDFYAERPGKARNADFGVIAGVKWQSEDTVDYYYGVKDSEATATRTAYKGKAATTPYIGLAGQGNITKNLTFNTSAVIMRAPDEISDSPIVDDDHDVQFNAGLTYWFY
jgi:outer membrane protein